MGSIVVSCAECGTKNRIPDVRQHQSSQCGKCKAPLHIKDFVIPVELTDSTMDGFVKNENLPVLVDFFSPTCGPCATLAPLLQKLTKKFYRKVIIATIDTSKNPGCAAFYKIKGVPTLIFFKDGAVVDQITGLPAVTVLEAKLEYLSK